MQYADMKTIEFVRYTSTLSIIAVFNIIRLEKRDLCVSHKEKQSTESPGSNNTDFGGGLAL